MDVSARGAAGAVRSVRLTAGQELPEPTVELDSDQQAVVQHHGHAIVMGGPGSGKTTALIEYVAARALTSSLDRILVLTHARSNAQQLRSRLVRRLGRTSTGSTVMTVHGLCLALLRRFSSVEDGSFARLLMAPEQDFRIRELLAGYPTERWPTDLAQAAQTRGLASQLRAVLAAARQRSLDPHDLRELGRRWNDPAWEAVGDFFENYLDVLDAEGVIDYAELVHRTRLLLLDDSVQAALREEFDAVVVDEFSECDPSQVALIGQVGQLGCSVVVFADPATRVFGFRGADPRGVEHLAQMLQHEIGVGVRRSAERFTLRYNHRTGGRLAQVVEQVSQRLPSSSRSSAIPTQAEDLQLGVPPAPDVQHWEPGQLDADPFTCGARPAPGRVAVEIFDTPGAEADHIANALRTEHIDGQLEWADMAVICRTGRGSLPVLSRALTASGIPVEVAGDEMPLSDEAAVRPLIWGLEAALALAGGKDLEPDQVLRLLRSPIGGLDSVAIRRLARQLRQQGRDGVQEDESHPDELPPPSAQAITACLVDSARGQADSQIEEPSPDVETVSAETVSPERAAVIALGRLLRGVADSISAGETAQVTLWQLWNGSQWPQRLQSEALTSGEGSRRAHRDLDAVCALFDLAARAQEMVGERGVRGLLAEIGGQAIPADTMRESNIRRRGVRLLTAHRAKGEQWPFVVVAGVQEGTWPVVGRRGRLIDPDELDPARDGLEGPLPMSATAEVLADERRLFLLAISRASRKLLVTASAGTEGEHDQPSRFVREVGLDPERVMGRPRRTMTLTGLTAELRRVASDPLARPGLRDAAAARLAGLAQARDGRGQPLVPSADPERWWGIAPLTVGGSPIWEPGRQVELSGSALESILQCPRQWFLSRRVKADSIRSSAQSFGSLLHVLVQHAVSDGLTLPTLEQHLETVWDQVPFDAQWVAASERAEADAALERFVAWHEMYQGRTVLGVEVAFRQPVMVDGQRVHLIGSVDRLELDSAGRLRIIDFKTGRTVPSAARAAASNQLGVYQLAAMSGAFEDLAPGVREVAGADLVYLRRNEGSGAPFPKVLTQPSLQDQPHGTLPASSEAGEALESLEASVPTDASGRPTWVHDRIGEALTLIQSENFCAIASDACQWCPFRVGCPAKGKELL